MPPQDSSLFLMFPVLLMSSVPKRPSSEATLPLLLVSPASRLMLLLKLLSSNRAVVVSPAHAAAEAAVLLQQGRAPANLNAGELAHFQAEQAVRAAEQNLIVNGLQG
eukprot:TRINITY_DN39_c0_g1_i5.p1 TRINITY_DN39_c0_g1~~TRINITY_DN39_c0_g1_i5.p1  ORF type:complete len:107 (+),score=36.13 TRINITY_DN39_c0_g1_i5:253-573(+)